MKPSLMLSSTAAALNAPGSRLPTSGLCTRACQRNSGILRLQEFGKLVRRHGSIEIKALKFVAGVLAQEIRLLLRFHTLGHYRNAQALAHRDNGLRQVAIIASGSYISNVRAIDLYGIERKALQRGKRGITGSKVVDRNLYPHGLQLGQYSQRLL